MFDLLEELRCSGVNDDVLLRKPSMVNWETLSNALAQIPLNGQFWCAVVWARYTLSRHTRVGTQTNKKHRLLGIKIFHALSHGEQPRVPVFHRWLSELKEASPRC